MSTSPPQPQPQPVDIQRRERVFAKSPSTGERTVALSLLDATTANFALTNACWLFEKPAQLKQSPTWSLVDHLRETLRIALDAYPQFCGRLRAIDTVAEDPTAVPDQVKAFPAHARRFGRVYVQFGSPDADAGVEFVTASSSASLDELHPVTRVSTQPLWNRQQYSLQPFVPPGDVAHALKPPAAPGTDGPSPSPPPPIMAIQFCELSCGGFVLAAKIAHPLADISALTVFVQDWASISRAVLQGTGELPQPNPIFDPQLLDSMAAGDINAAEPDPATIQYVESLPLHRYDWWAPPGKPPAALEHQPIKPTGNVMPWTEWDVKAPVSTYTIHFTRDQIEKLWSEVNLAAPPGELRISRHDAILAHIWSCIMRARDLSHDTGPVHCDLTLGLRAALGLDRKLIASPTMMTNIAMSATEVAAPQSLPLVAQRIRQTLATMTRKENLAAHLHRLAYEQSPQRIWQAFLGQRHILVTTWGRAGIYEVDFGCGSRLRYAEGVMPSLDGMVLIKEAPPPPPSPSGSSAAAASIGAAWTDAGVDISLSLRSDQMERLLQDTLLLPRI